MALITFNVSDDISLAMDLNSKKLGITRTEYLKRSIRAMNASVENEELIKKMIQSSYKIRSLNSISDNDFLELGDE